MLPYGCEAITPYEILFTRYVFKELYQDALSSHIIKMFEIYKGAFILKQMLPVENERDFWQEESRT